MGICQSANKLRTSIQRVPTPHVARTIGTVPAPVPAPSPAPVVLRPSPITLVDESLVTRPVAIDVIDDDVSLATDDDDASIVIDDDDDDDKDQSVVVLDTRVKTDCRLNNGKFVLSRMLNRSADELETSGIAVRKIRVIDGDTLDVWVERDKQLGFYVTIRVARIDCPESDTDAGQLATEFVKSTFLNHNARVTVFPIKFDKYGRLLGEVEFYHTQLKTKVNLSDFLVEHKHALPYNGRGQRPRHTRDDGAVKGASAESASSRC